MYILIKARMERDGHTLSSGACVITFPFSQRNPFWPMHHCRKLQTSTKRQQTDITKRCRFCFLS